MTQVLTQAEIREALHDLDLVSAMERAFVAYSTGQAVVPPVGELTFDDPPGDVHIKYGYLKDDDYYVIKVASGFYDNPGLGLPSSNGLMLLFDQKTGRARAILLDEGLLTDLRTAAAGALTARTLAPSHVERIGIVGTGVQAELQLRQLASVHPCRQALVLGRSEESLADYRQRLGDGPFAIDVTLDSEEIVDSCQLIVTTTPSSEALLSHVHPGTHVTAIGADTREKRELADELMANADLVVVDSLPQSLERGEVYQAVASGSIDRDSVVELGKLLIGEERGRRDDAQVTVADLTGVATQDIEISKAVYRRAMNAD
ncbi:MAG: ornithine cyclodeaminase family protein [Pseudomonadota bacterium]